MPLGFSAAKATSRARHSIRGKIPMHEWDQHARVRPRMLIIYQTHGLLHGTG